MVVSVPRRWQWILAILWLLLVVFLVAFVVIGLRGRAAVDTVSAATPVRAEAVAAQFEPAVPQRAIAALQIEAPPDPRGGDEIQACGGAWLKAQADGSLDRAAFARAPDPPGARERALAALRADPGDLTRALLLWIAPQRSAGRPPDDAADAADARDALARMAVASTDARVYALAFSACNGVRPGEGACRLLSADQWARLDPANATPWFFSLGAARARGDRAGQDEALHRIATSRRSDFGFFVLPGLVANAAPDDEAGMLAAWRIAMKMIDMEAAWALPGYAPLAAACRGDALRDANRRQTCDAIADLLVQRSDTLLERTVGVSIGRQLGWPSEVGEQLRGEVAAYLATLRAPTDGAQGLDCAGIRRELDTLQRHAVSGEAGALRDWVTQSGKAPAEFAVEERARLVASDTAARENK